MTTFTHHRRPHRHPLRLFRPLLLSLFVALLLHSPASAQIITTVAGDSTRGYCCDGMPAIEAELNGPVDVAFDPSGNLYVAEAKNNRIRKVDKAGIITTFAGTGVAGYNGDGIQATAAQINVPAALAFDAAGNLYFCDDINCRIRMISTAGIISTVAGTGTSGFSGDNGPASAAMITNILGIAINANGDIIFSDNLNNRIRKIDNSPAHIITTVAGTGTSGFSGDNGPATLATMNQPTGVACDASGNIYFGAYNNFCVRKISTAGIITTIAGIGDSPGSSGDNGPATLAKFKWVNGLKVDPAGNVIITDVYNNKVRKVDNSGIITTIVGTGALSYNGDGQLAALTNIGQPSGVCFDQWQGLYIAEWTNARVRYLKYTEDAPGVLPPGSAISVYPNPSSGHITLTVHSDLDQPVAISLINLLGSSVREYSGYTNQPIPINAQLPSGNYIVACKTASGLQRTIITIF